MMSNDFERRDSRKRRRLSERRRVFSRIGLSGEKSGMLSGGGDGGDGSLSTEQSSWSTNSSHYTHNNTLEDQQSRSNSRSDSPLGDNNKISMKIQFHIAVAPDNEPLILDTNCLSGSLASAAASTTRTSETSSNSRKKSISESIGDHIHERLSRQNTASTRRRQHLLAMHNQTALDTTASTNGNNNIRRASALSQSTSRQADQEQVQAHSDDMTNNPLPYRRATAGELLLSSSATGGDSMLGREPGVRSSTMTDGMSDEATVEFLARHNASHQQQAKQANNHNREHIFFKRDGQRFGHEFTLKLAVDRTYRCLLKVRPLIPLQGISIQGQHVLYADCSQTGSIAAAAALNSASAPASSTALNKQSWQNIQHQTNSHQHQPLSTTNQCQQQRQYQRHLGASGYEQPQFNTVCTSVMQQHNHHHRLYHAQTTTSIYAPSATVDAKLLARSLLYQQQQNQMMRHFAASPSNPHLGSQLIYMFDWSASRFEVNKNKARTQVQTVLKFKNGQILSLPLQVKFYQSECKQHLNWGSQLHFIDYDCSINSMGQINVDRIQYY